MPPAKHTRTENLQVLQTFRHKRRCNNTDSARFTVVFDDGLLEGHWDRPREISSSLARGDALSASREAEPFAARTSVLGRHQSSAGGSIGNGNGKGNYKMGHQSITIHEDGEDALHQAIAAEKNYSEPLSQQDSEDEGDDDEHMDESMSDTESEEEADESVLEEMQKLEENFHGISQRYRLINRIGEGTFSTVYKAEQLVHPGHSDQENENPDTSVDVDVDGDGDMPSQKRRKLQSSNGKWDRPKPTYVALKKIYVTSSPHRILNELEILHELRDSDYICKLITAFRHHDQVVAVLPYFRHLDFRLYYRDFLVNDMRHYFRSLFHALAYVHKAGILHRDIKPTNFLYNHAERQGVLVDFGLAERQGTDWQPCLCGEKPERRREKFLHSAAVKAMQSQSEPTYPKSDTRTSRRANRAGTRGFRAPEVLLKCTSQTTKIDIWSAGVILLTLLARRFPFFNSADDVDAMIEIASIFGRKKMTSVAAMHGQLFETNIETIGERGFTLEKIIIWASCREKEHDRLRAGEAQAVEFLEGLLELDCQRRWSAKEALRHPFFTAPVEDEEERAEREAHEAAENEYRRR